VKQWFYSFVRQRTLRPAQNGPLWRSFLLCGILLTLPGTAAAAALQLNWQDQSTNESGFKIERLNGSSYAPIATVAANVKTYMDGNVTAGVSYCYRVRALTPPVSRHPPKRSAPRLRLLPRRQYRPNQPRHLLFPHHQPRRPRRHPFYRLRACRGMTTR
jgi:hypothetical protein